MRFRWMTKQREATIAKRAFDRTQERLEREVAACADTLPDDGRRALADHVRWNSTRLDTVENLYPHVPEHHRRAACIDLLGQLDSVDAEE